MSRENVEIVRSGYESWAQGDLSGMLDLIDDGVVTRRVAPAPDPGTWHGKDGLLESISDWIAEFDDFSMEAEEYIDAGDAVVVRTRHRGRGTGSGVPVDATFWFVYGFDGGKITSFDTYVDGEQALEAVGLRE